MADKKRGIGFSFAWNGLLTVIKSERNFRIHLVATCLVVGAGIYFSLQHWEWVALLLVVGLVLTAEMVNSALERIIDYIKPEIHPSAKEIKDIGAGVVLIAAIMAGVIGLIIFLPKVISVLI